MVGYVVVESFPGLSAPGRLAAFLLSLGVSDCEGVRANFAKGDWMNKEQAVKEVVMSREDQMKEDAPRMARLLQLMPWLHFAKGRKKDRKTTRGTKGAFGGQKAKTLPAEQFSLCQCGSGHREDRCCNGVTVSQAA
jgi:hypothetical protein